MRPHGRLRGGQALHAVQQGVRGRVDLPLSFPHRREGESLLHRQGESVGPLPRRDFTAQPVEFRPVEQQRVVRRLYRPRGRRGSKGDLLPTRQPSAAEQSSS